MKRPVNVLLVEDNRNYGDVLALALAGDRQVRLVQRFATAEVALRHLRDEAVDVILLDLRLPGMSGIEAIPQFREVAPHAKIIVLTQSDAEADVIRCISLGASGYLLKSAAMGEIFESVHSVAQGGASLDRKVARFILDSLKERLPEGVPATALSERETEILTMIADGLVKKQIAKGLHVSYATVDSHVRHIYEKLQVGNAASAVSKAYSLGILSLQRKPPS